VAMSECLLERAQMVLVARFLSWEARVWEHPLVETLTWSPVDQLARVLEEPSR